MDDYGTFQPDELNPLIPDNYVPGSFLQRIMYPRRLTFTTAEVYFDRVIPDRRRAPLVAPTSPGKVHQPRGFRLESLVPASYKPKNQITGKEVMSRMAGERIGGEMTPGERAAAIREMYLTEHQKKITRSLEWQAAQQLQTGAMTLVADDYPSVTVDFQRTGSHTKALLTTDRWGESGVSPWDDWEDWSNTVAEDCGAPVTASLFDRLAWQLFKADPKFDKMIDRTLGQTTAMDLGFTKGVPGAPTFKGRAGDTEFYVYNDIQEDDAGTPEKLLPDYSVGLIAQGGLEGGILFGCPQHAENNYAEAEFFPHNWIDPNTGVEWVETITNPIAAAGRIDGTLFATVR